VTYLIDNQTVFSSPGRWRSRLLAMLAVGVMLLFVGWGAQPARASFGFLPGAAGFDGAFTNRDGTTDTQAGSRPYDFTTTVNLNLTPNFVGRLVPDGAPKDLTVDLPPGFIGDTTATTKCTPEQLAAVNENVEPEKTCPVSSQVGVVLVELAGNQGGGVSQYASVFDMVAPRGVPAVLGFNIAGVLVYVDTKVRTGAGYNLYSALQDIPGGQPTRGTKLTLWGVPGDPSHDDQRCVSLLESVHGDCEEIGYPPAEPHGSDIPRKPFLTLPTSCMGPQTVGAMADSWQEPGVFVQASFLTHNTSGEPIGFEGCDQLGFTPTISAQPETSAAVTPTGLQVDVHLPQNDDPEGLAEAELKNAVVTLPAGMSVNPSSADGQGVCSPGQIELSGPQPASCPEASKIGNLEAVTPVLEHPLQGGVYLAEQGNNPFGSLLAIYLAIADPQTGVVIKLAGHVELNPQTGQLQTTFVNNPQLPFEDLKLDFFSGPRAPLVTPSACGSFTTTSDLTPWTSPYALDATPGDSFQVASGSGGAACGNGFAPSFTAGTVNPQAGAFSPFSTTFARTDQEQALAGVSVTTPPGLLGILKSVERCGEPQASQGTCGAGSLVGHVSALVGAGPDPYEVQGGQVFLTGPYKGAPFGLSIVVPAVAGPFNLGNVVVRAAIGVDPHTAQITVTSDPLPSILQGIPLLVRKVNVTIDRSGFIFNPTNCNSFSVSGAISSTQGVSVPVASHFQAANCATLPFKPTFAVSTQGKTSKQNGASLAVKVTSGAGQANIGKVSVTLPKQLPSRLTTIQQACPEATFAANPASCPAGSDIGTATAQTPVLASPVTGPAYLVSHGGAAFPDLVIILQGEDITLQLVGSIDIKKSVTSSTFGSVPDAPIETFALVLPEGPHSALTTALPAKAKGNLCGTGLVMPTTITGQNGAVITQSTKIAVSGCPKARPKKKTKTKARSKHPKKGGKTHK
jgi:hypothetical protein